MPLERPYTPDERLSADNAALVLIDHQTGLLSACKDIPVERLRHNILGLAKIGKLFGLPVVLTQGGYGGMNAGGPLMAEFEAIRRAGSVFVRPFLLATVPMPNGDCEAFERRIPTR